MKRVHLWLGCNDKMFMSGEIYLFSAQTFSNQSKKVFPLKVKKILGKE
jgi:hypothetical protein